MKKMLSFVLAFCFTANVFASTGSVGQLNKAIDDYEFALTVEWDQKDKKFHEEKTQAFFRELGTLMAQGVDREAILAVAEKKMGKKESFEALKLKLSLLSHVQTPEELGKLLSQNSADFYGKGASWSGGLSAGTVGIVLAVAAVIGFAVWFGANYECVAWSERYECDTDSYCDDWGCHSDTSCGYVDYCVDWQKKK